MKYPRRIKLVAGCLAGTLWIGGGCQLPSEPPGVELQVLDYEGIQRLVAGHRGRIVVVDAWSTSCPPCIKEFPGLVALDRKYGPDQVACISVSLDYEGIGWPEGVQAEVLAFLERQGATFDNVLSSTPSDELLEALGIFSIPAVFVYDRSGALAKRFDTRSGQEFTYADVERLVQELIAAETKDEG